MTLQNLKNEITIRGFSPRTAEIYTYFNTDFLNYSKKEVGLIGEDDVRAYLAHLINERKFKPRSLNLAISALKFYYDDIQEKNLFRKIKKLKIEERQLEIPTKVQLDSLFKAAANNPGHMILIGFFCGSGLRVSENVQLTFENINEKEGLAVVKLGKGAKDRNVIFSKKIVEALKTLREERKNDPNRFIFKSDSKVGHISRQQAWGIVKRYAKLAGIPPESLSSPITCILCNAAVGVRI